MWNNFGINLSAEHPVSIVGIDTGVAQATVYIGNIVNEFSPTTFPHGALGITSDQPSTTRHTWIGAYTRIDSTYYNDERYSLSDDVIKAHTGSYLVKTNVIPVPPAVWLFGSGLLGLVGIARRKVCV